ncbi:MAG: hydrogenase maturation protease [Acidobacteriota bacterium]|nr:hydrogenase maturation protease [Acidobacteriota bacterium]
MTRVLVGGVGYRNLRDHSFGVVLVDGLDTSGWPPGVSVEDISYNPIAVVQRLQDDRPDQRFDLAVMVGALQRPGRAPGTLSVYRWDNVMPAPLGIHEAITEAVTGIISLDNTLVVARHFDALPATVVVLELEPDAHEFGSELTPAVAAALRRARELVVQLAFEPSAAALIPEGAIPDSRIRHTGVVFGQVSDDRPGIH